MILSRQIRLWSDCASVQVDPGLPWPHMLEDMFFAWRGILTLVKSRCPAHLKFSANQIAWSRMLQLINILNGKQCRSQLIWIYTDCKGWIYPGLAWQGLRVLRPVLPWSSRTSMARTSWEPMKFVLYMCSSCHGGLIIMPVLVGGKSG